MTPRWISRSLGVCSAKGHGSRESRGVDTQTNAIWNADERLRAQLYPGGPLSQSRLLLLAEVLDLVMTPKGGGCADEGG